MVKDPDDSDISGELIGYSIEFQDFAGNKGDTYVSELLITIDTVYPNIMNVTSNIPDGYYTIGEEIDIKVTFQEYVWVKNSLI